MHGAFVFRLLPQSWTEPDARCSSVFYLSFSLAARAWCQAAAQKLSGGIGSKLYGTWFYSGWSVCGGCCWGWVVEGEAELFPRRGLADRQTDRLINISQCCFVVSESAA